MLPLLVEEESVAPSTFEAGFHLAVDAAANLLVWCLRTSVLFISDEIASEHPGASIASAAVTVSLSSRLRKD